MANGSVLRVDEGGNNIARVGLSIEGTAGGGTAILSDANGGFADPFELLDVRSSVGGEARTLQVGATGGSEEPMVTSLLGTSTVDVTVDVFNGKFTVASGGDVQGSVKVRSGSTFLTLNPVEELVNLGGDGVVVGSVAVSNIFSPGLSPGTLTVTGDVTFLSTTIHEFELDLGNTVVGSGTNDLLFLVGPGSDLVLDGTLNVTNYTGGIPTVGDFWVLMQYNPAASFTSNGLDLGIMPDITGIGIWALDYGTMGEVHLLVVVPEPSTWLLLAMGFGMIGVLARRRKNG
jgi:hypothetical protein